MITTLPKYAKNKWKKTLTKTLMPHQFVLRHSHLLQDQSKKLNKNRFIARKATRLKKLLTN